MIFYPPTIQESLDFLQDKTKKWSRGENVEWKEYDYPLTRFSHKKISSRKIFYRGKIKDFYGI